MKLRQALKYITAGNYILVAGAIDLHFNMDLRGIPYVPWNWELGGSFELIQLKKCQCFINKLVMGGELAELGLVFDNDTFVWTKLGKTLINSRS